MSTIRFPSCEPQSPPDRSRCSVLDSHAESALSDFTWLTSQLCDFPISLISLVDPEGKPFKSMLGLPSTEPSRVFSFCAHPAQSTGMIEVPDATLDPRFSSHPLVTGEPKIRSYAGLPLTPPGGNRLGSLCVMDRIPRRLTERQREALVRLGRQVVAQFELQMARAALTTQLVASKKTAQAKEFQSAIVESSVDAIVGLSLDHVVTSWNKGAERIFGYSASEMVGNHMDRLIPADCVPDRISRLQRIRAGELVDHFETVHLTKNGSRVQLSMSLSPIKNVAGQLMAISVVARNITEQKLRQAEQEKLITDLQDATVEIQTLSSMLPMCAWCHKIRDDQGYWDDVATFFGKRQGIQWSHGICPTCSRNWTSSARKAPSFETAYFKKLKQASSAVSVELSLSSG